MMRRSNVVVVVAYLIIFPTIVSRINAQQKPKTTTAPVSTSAARDQERYAGVVEQILSAWKTADVVCLGEAHDRYYDNELRIALVRHPAFSRTVRAIVVEMANPVRQDLLDRFILDGAALSREEIAPIWRDAENPEVWESPIYEEFLRAVRDVNLRLPRGQRVRVLAGDSRVDWSKVTRPEELIPLMNRGGNIREIIATEVLDKNLKALAIYGTVHCLKIGRGFPGDLAGRYAKGRMWSITPVLFKKQRTENTLEDFSLGAEPAYIGIAGSRWEAMSGGVLDSVFTSWKIGQLCDAMVYHGDVPDRIVGADMATFRARMGPEVDRRAKLLRDASKLRRY
jgi:hypothetical protein